MLSTIPVFAVMVENLGERGAHYLAYKMFVELEAVELKAAETNRGSEAIAAAATAPLLHPQVDKNSSSATCPFASLVSKTTCNKDSNNPGKCPIDAHCVMWSLVAATVGAAAAMAFMRLKR